MTIQSPIARLSFPCNGVSAVFPVNIQAYNASDFLVLATNAAGSIVLTLNSDYTLASSGSLTPPFWSLTTQTGQLASPFATGFTLQVILNPAETQLSQYTQGQAFPSLAVQTNLDRLTQMAIRQSDILARAIVAPDGDVSPVMALPAAASRASKNLGFDPSGNLAVNLALASGTISTATLAPFLRLSQTPAEASLLITPVNQQYPAGYVDRYATNAFPGTTDMVTAFNSAAKVANALGCEARWGETAPYRLNSAANFTVLRGVVFRDESSANLSNNVPSLIIGHNGIAFDFAGSVELTFHNIVFQNAAANVPQTWLYTGRVAGAGCGLHRFYNCRSTFNSKASWAFYGVGSEENNFYGCTFYQNQGGSGIISHNVSNPANILSTFVTVGAGVSGTENHHYGFGYYQLGNGGSNTETIFQLDQASNTTIRDGTWGNAHGLSHISVVGAGAITNLTLDSIRGEPLGTKGLNGILVANTAGINTGWTLNNVTVDTTGYLINFQAAQTPAIQNLVITASTSTSGLGVNAYTMSNSDISFLGGNTINGQAGGNVSGNTFRGWRAQVTLNGAAPSPPNIYLDNNAGTVGIDGDSFTAANTACTGALTTSAIWTLRLSPNGKEVTLSLPSTLGTTTAAPSFTFGVVIPAAYRPGANVRQIVATQDNAASLAGLVTITNTGSIIVNKDTTGALNFTNGVSGGLPQETIVKWLIGI